MISIKSNGELEIISEAGRILAEIGSEIINYTKQGIITEEIDRYAERLIREKGGEPAFKGYKGFPANICISINEEVVHGIPNTREIKTGDIVSIDIGIKYKDYYADTAFTLGIGNINGRLKKLMETSKESLSLAIKKARVNNRVSDISWAIQSYVESKGFSVVRDFVGHGIGRQLHEDPQIPNFGRPHQGQVLKAGMVLAIESMVNLGRWEIEISQNGWTAITKDRLPSCHFEHTVVVTEKDPRILTRGIELY